MVEKHYLDIVMVKEKLSTGEPVFVAHCTSLGITSQGMTVEEATINIQEAIQLYLEECTEKWDELESESPPSFSFVEVVHHAKVAHIVRA